MKNSRDVQLELYIEKTPEISLSSALSSLKLEEIVYIGGDEDEFNAEEQHIIINPTVYTKSR
jgi:hypothetical protein